MSAHEVLGIAKGASAREIRQAYKRLARKYHPDRNPSDESAERFKAIKAAHDEMLEKLAIPSPQRSPSPSQSRASASRRTSSRASRRNWRTADPGPRVQWPPPNFEDRRRGPSRTTTGAPRSRTAGRRPSPSMSPEMPYDDADSVLMRGIQWQEGLRSALWLFAGVAWLLMFGGFMFALRSTQSLAPVRDTAGAEVGAVEAPRER